jgi:hypothetical protein
MQQQKSTCMKLASRNGMMQMFWMPGGSHTWEEVQSSQEILPSQVPAMPCNFGMCCLHAAHIVHMYGGSANERRQGTDF